MTDLARCAVSVEMSPVYISCVIRRSAERCCRSNVFLHLFSFSAVRFADGSYPAIDLPRKQFVPSAAGGVVR